jgi:hypothetical protein
MKKFMAEYSIEDGYCNKDGYVNKDRFQSFYINENEIEKDMTEGELIDLFEDKMQRDFEQNIMPYGDNIDDFLDFAKEMQKTKT